LDGTPIDISEGGPADVEAVSRFMLGLSADSRHDRFFSIQSPEALREEIRGELSAPGNVSLLARAGDGRIVGHALAAPLGDARAELAFAIADDMQHHGLGTALLGAIVRAMRERGIRRYEATMLAENRPMRGIFAAAGFQMIAGSGCVAAFLEDPA
jgi:RimJ/RimL family protein N-acetyltransferase